jgi:hypothetical protein
MAATTQTISKKSTTPIVAQGILICVTGLLFGGLIGFEGPIMGVAATATLVVLMAFFVPLSWVFVLLLVVTFFLAGPIQYFGHVQKIFWLPYLIGLLLLLRTLIAHFFRRRNTSTFQKDLQTYPVLAMLFGLYIVTLFVSSAVNSTPPLQMLLSLKEYFFLLGAGTAIVWGLVNQTLIDKLFQYGHWFLLAQFPVVLYQHFVVAAERTGSSPWDAVVGLMSGDPTSGGASATMALSVIMIMTYNLAAWRKGLCGNSKLLFVLVVGMASIMLAEVKFAILLIPIALALVYLKEIVYRPLFGVAILAGAVTLGALVLYAYQFQFSGAHSKASVSVSEYVTEVLENNAGGDQINMLTGEMGRIAAFKFWWRNHGAENPVHLFLGHGIGASRIGLVSGEVAQRFRFEVGRSSMVTLLWEGGIITAVAAFFLFLFGAIHGFRKSQQATSPQELVMYQTAAIGLLLTLAMMPYGPDLIYVSQAQLIAILLLARVVANSKNATEVP